MLSSVFRKLSEVDHRKSDRLRFQVVDFVPEVDLRKSELLRFSVRSTFGFGKSDWGGDLPPHLVRFRFEGFWPTGQIGPCPRMNLVLDSKFAGTFD